MSACRALPRIVPRAIPIISRGYFFNHRNVFAASLPQVSIPFLAMSTTIKESDDTKGYQHYQKNLRQHRANFQERPNRFQQISEREYRSDIPLETFETHDHGKYCTLYRGCEVVKSPEDIVIYMQLLANVKPATVFEIGAMSGGTAIWLADMLKVMEVQCQIHSMDIDLSLLHDRVKELKPPNVNFIQGDCYKIEESFPTEFLLKQPHPWVLFEDAHTNVFGLLEYFHQFMQIGDYFVIDDTRIYPESNNETWGLNKMNALKKFLVKHNVDYAVDSFYTDFYGYNGTGNWNGYIRRM